MWTVYKKPFDQFAISDDFINDVGSGNTVASITAVSAVNELTGANSTAEVISSSSPPQIQGTAVVFVVTGGAVGERHMITVQIVSSLGEEYQGDIELRIVG